MVVCGFLYVTVVLDFGGMGVYFLCISDAGQRCVFVSHTPLAQCCRVIVAYTLACACT